MANAWFLKYMDTDPMVSSNYVKQTSQPSCTGHQHICAIYAQVLGGTQPNITEALRDEMISALQSCQNKPNVLLMY